MIRYAADELETVRRHARRNRGLCYGSSLYQQSFLDVLERNFFDGGSSGVGGLRPLVSFKPGGGGTFTRASEASYYNAPPNTTGGFLSWAPVNTIREDQIDGVAGGYLFEPAQTNLCYYSEDLSQASWIKGGGLTVSGTTAVAPDGAANCCTLAFTASATDSLSRPVAATTDATAYTSSVWVRKTAGTGSVRLRVIDRNSVTTTTANISISTTWKRIEYVAVWGTGVATPEIHLLNDVAGTAQSVEVWGWDIKSSVIGGAARNAPSSYVRTTSAAATRAADDLSFATTPTAMLSGRYTFRFAPNYATGESSASSAYFTTGTTFNGIDSRTGISTLSAQLANVVKIAGPAITFASRNLVMTAIIDLAAARITITGATTGSGTGALGVAVSHTQAILYIGKFNAASTFYAGGRIWEPYAA